MGTLSWIDYLIIIISVLGAIAIGMYFARIQKSSDKFFTEGRTFRHEPLVFQLCLP